MTKDQLIADREKYRAGLEQLRTQQRQIEITIYAQLGILGFLEKKLAELESAPQDEPAKEPQSA